MVWSNGEIVFPRQLENGLLGLVVLSAPACHRKIDTLYLWETAGMERVYEEHLLRRQSRGNRCLCRLFERLRLAELPC
jgi:hypothetical protein